MTSLTHSCVKQIFLELFLFQNTWFVICETIKSVDYQTAASSFEQRKKQKQSSKLNDELPIAKNNENTVILVLVIN